MGRYPLNGKVALVTGAARGIGFATARLMHERGASVVVTDVDARQSDEAAGRIGERALGMAADVTDLGAVEAAVESAVERFGGLDVAVANAGIAPPTARTLRLVDPEPWERVIDVNLLGVWRTVRAAMPQVVERRGHMVLVASVYAFLNGAGASPYAASKAAVESLGRTLRAELSHLGASATTAYFGFIETAMTATAMEDPIARRFEQRLPGPLRRRVPPETAARAIVEAVERRAPRAIEPRAWRAAFALRGVFGPLMDRTIERDDELRELVREAEEREL